MSSIEVRATQSTVDDNGIRSTKVRRHPSRPRPRPTLSCLRCRHRKIKCDRLLPCRQCTLTGHGSKCSYNTRPLSGEAGVAPRISEPSTNAPLTNPGFSVYEAPNGVGSELESGPLVEPLISIQERVQKLEQLCANPSRAPVKTSDQKDEVDGRESIRSGPKADATLSIKPSGPRYHSQNYKKTLLQHFGVVGRFCQSGFDDPERGPVMNELRMHHDKWTKARRKVDKVEMATHIPFPLLELLPSASICDHAVSVYFRSFEKSMRILHYPSFLDEYQRFWASDDTCRAEFEAFIAQLAVIVAIIHAWEDIPTPASEKEFKADILCDHVEVWLDSLRGRKQLTITTLRTRALLVLAQQLRAVKADEVWKATGKLLRFAMTAGLHREPSEFPEISLFEGELRRRVWMTIVEMDLEASLTYGMPVMLHERDFTCKAPANVDDVDLFDGMTELPLAKPLEQSTDSVFQVVLVGSLPLRLRAMAELATRFGDVLAHIHSLELYIRSLPSKLRLDWDTKPDFGHTFATVQLNLYIKRVLSHLYRSSIAMTDDASEAIATGLKSSLSILSYQKLFDPEILASNDSQCERYWDLFHVLCKSDMMQAALDICLHVQEEGIVSWTRASLLLALDDTTDSLMRRVSRSGSDIKDILRLAMTSQLLKSQFMQADGEQMMKEAAQIVLTSCRKAARKRETLNKEDRNEMAVTPSPNTRIALENDISPVEWTTMPNSPSLTNSDFEWYFDADGNGFDILSGFSFQTCQDGLWSQ